MARHDIMDAANASDWIAPAGTEKRRCAACNKFFASRGTHRCPSCIAGRKGTASTDAGGFDVPRSWPSGGNGFSRGNE